MKGPFPEPWRSGPVPDPWSAEINDFQLQIQLTMRDVTQRIVDAAATASVRGGDGAAVIARSVDDWVHVDDGDGTGKVPFNLFRHRFRWIDPPRPPRPNELVELVPALAAAAWSFFSIAQTIRDPSLKAAIDAAVDTVVGRAARSLQEGTTTAS